MEPAAQLEALVSEIRAAPSLPAGASLAQLREGVDAMMAAHPVVDGTRFAPDEIAGMKALWSISPSAKAGRTILFYHGGGYILGSIDGYRAFASQLSQASGAAVLAVDYRLAPEHRFPAAADDAFSAYRHLLESGHDPAGIALAGDSAGGGLAIAALIAAKDAGLPMPLGAALVSPWLDMDVRGDSVDRNGGNEPSLSAGSLRMFADLYLGEGGPRDTALASPLHGDLKGLPPVLLEVGSHEILLDDALKFAGRAAAADVRVMLEVRPRMFHGFHNRSAVLSEAEDTIRSVGAFLEARFTNGPSWECR